MGPGIGIQLNASPHPIPKQGGNSTRDPISVIPQTVSTKGGRYKTDHKSAKTPLVIKAASAMYRLTYATHLLGMFCIVGLLRCAHPQPKTHTPYPRKGSGVDEDVVGPFHL